MPRLRTGPRGLVGERPCETCGRTFTAHRRPDTPSGVEKYCSTSCYHLHQMARSMRRQAQQAIRRDRARAQRAKERAELKAKARAATLAARVMSGVCAHCSAEFEYIRIRQPRIYCGPRCKIKASRHAARARRRARVKGDHRPRVFRRDVIARDGGVCMICHKAVRLNAPPTHPLAVSLDHIVPLAWGGTHEMSNVQLSHLRCNRRKAAHTPVQLRWDASA